MTGVSRLSRMVSDFAGAVSRAEIPPRGSVYAEGSGGVSGGGRPRCEV